MDKQILKNQLKTQAKSLAWRAITTIILTLVAIATIWVYAVGFVEPSVGPNDSDQDFAQNILGANNADNDFDSSNVVANNDGSIIERLESIASTTVAIECGNGVIELGEGCDDGGTSWSSGACAGDCSKNNYWLQPLVGSRYFPAYADSLNRWCQEQGWLRYATYTSTGNEAVIYWSEQSYGWVWYHVTNPATQAYINAIWCQN